MIGLGSDKKTIDGKSLSTILLAQFVTLFFTLGLCQGHICNFVMMPKSVFYRQMMGTTNPANAAPGTIRFQYPVVHTF